MAEAANRVAEGVRHELAAQRAHTDLTGSEDRWSAEAPGGERTVVAAEEVMADARKLQASAERLSRTLAESRQRTPTVSGAQTAATQPPGEDDDDREPRAVSTTVSEGLRILIRQLAIETEDREEIAARLRSQYGVADARAAVDAVLDIDASGQDAI